MKRKSKTIIAAAAAVCIAFAAGGCGAEGVEREGFVLLSENGGAPNYVYDAIVEQDFCLTSQTPENYFSLDRNTSSYSLVRAQLNAGNQIAYDSVRTEELVNYFTYDYPAPAEGEELSLAAYLSECPWNTDHELLTVGIRTQKRVLDAERNNYVLLIDVSGSMSARVTGLDGITCLDLVKYGAEKMTETLGENDSVCVVTYANGVETVLEPTLATAEGKTDMIAAIKGLTAYGGTNGSGGLQLAYQNAEKYMSDQGNNRVILMTDGDFNIGISDKTQLKKYISEKAESGVYLSVIGVGMGNLRDDIMQSLALSGNGNYAYIDTLQEAEKVMCEELNGMLTVVCKDAKAGVTFNADNVEAYRILGYDMKQMSKSEYESSKTDAGEIGSNLCVSVLYEIVPTKSAAEGAALATVEIKYKSAAENEAEKSVSVVALNAHTGGDDQAFAACVIEFGLVLRRSQYKGAASLAAALSRLNDLAEYVQADVYKSEFVSLVKKAVDSRDYE